MAPRPNWKGYLKLALVSCPVALYPAASSSERISFHMMNRSTGNRLKQQYIDAETGDLVESADRVKGYEVARNDYVLLEPEELKEVQIESTHTIEIEHFVPRSEIDPVYYDAAYYIVPDDEVGAEAFAVIREAMRKRDMVGLARVVLYGRERIIMLEPRGKGLAGTTLRYNYEVRDDKTYFDEITNKTVAKDMLDLASHIIDTKVGHFDPSEFKDRYQDAVVDLIRAKRAGKPLPTPAAPKPSNVVNLMDALKRSLKTEKSGKGKASESKSASKSSARARPAARRTARSRASAKSHARKAG
ncbi:MAG: end-binding protein Ku [Methylobacteriaceae bacterium]|jgi:DNA end-binding protein Ku|nr:end-binding protein Ku [Methylobacteriaceae bacterium]